MKYHCILLVDDDEINNYLNIRLLQKLQIGLKLITVHNGQEALNYIKTSFESVDDSCTPDLILLDINMPVMNGFEFLENFKDLDFDSEVKPKVVMLTTSSSEVDLNRAKKYGIKHHLIKPLSEETLLSYLNQQHI